LRTPNERQLCYDTLQAYWQLTATKFIVKRNLFWASALIFIAALYNLIPLSAQDVPIPNAPCGVVDAIGYPLESVETRTLAEGYDDFGLFRPRFGGRHTGLDVGFREGGETVRAAARGRVTYADIEGWDTEKGVVIIEHVFPNDEIYYTLYGHMEESETAKFPEVGDCMEMGDAVGAVGFPSMSAPHLHFEVRNFLPDDGGPGYVEGNPLEEGWYQPLDFVALWRMRLSPAFVRYSTFENAPTIPPAMMSDGKTAIASGDVISVVAEPDTILWRINLDDLASGIAALQDGGVVARSRSGQVVTVSNGRFSALWIVEGPDVPFAYFDNQLIFVTDGGGLAAYTPSGDAIWSLDAPDDAGDVLHADSNSAAIAVSVEVEDGVLWRAVDSTGSLIYERVFDDEPLVAHAPDGSWTLLTNAGLLRLNGGVMQTIGGVNVRVGRTAAFTVDALGASYLYAGDSARTLISWDAAGAVRWEATYPSSEAEILSPILQADTGCLLYSLSVEGQLYIFDAISGDLVNQLTLYAGGSQSRQPRARLLQPKMDGTVDVNAGFLTMMTLDSPTLGDGVMESCVLG
jgi:murein DD-endopeptidase MepM/ murein hydrolase activator NlpD